VKPLEAVERSARITAEACASVLGALVGAEGSFSDVDVHEEPASPFDTMVFPLVAVRIAYTEGLEGENVFILEPLQARRLAAAMMGADAPPDEGLLLDELELSAVSEAMNQMMGNVATAMANATDRPTDIATPQTTQLTSRDEASDLEDARYAAHFTLTSGPIEARFVQLVPEALASLLVTVFHSADVAEEVLAGHHREAVAKLTDETTAAVERTARIAAESSAEVLSTLLATRVSATLPEIEVAPDDPLGSLSYPLVTVEVSYVSGVNGANLFVLTPVQAATLAAAMIGADEVGDGLSDLELSAVSEAMNQMMGAATNILADTLSLDIEVAPPICQVMDSAEHAREAFSDPAYCSRFRIVSDRLTADVVQLVPGDFALHLQQAFAAADIGRAVVAEPTPAAAASGIGTPAQANQAATRTAPASVDLGALRRVRVRVSAELGRARLPIGRIANMPPGAIVELDRAPDDPIDVFVNGRPYARARLVLVDGEYAVQILSLTPPQTAAA
jgi:flagellar motor switch protein FliN/FliY